MKEIKIELIKELKKEQRERIIKRHHHSIWMHGKSPQALYWENSEVQQLRFDVLLGCGVSEGDSVLDVGCGFADLYRHMQNNGIDVDYTGLDLSPDMIDKAKEITPTLKLVQGDLFDFDPPEQGYDWVLLSGALNEPLQDEGRYLSVMIPRLYACCKKGLAFNLLNADHNWPARDLYMLQPYKPGEVLAQLNALSPYVTHRTDYMEVDASYFIWRDKKYRP
ncbi:MAG: class I SAM-dependent methyltransferase [Gammaproteobacteria bacterium]|nr:class I SAM-dependent methyltransferase [Gammaproteobacteria bacterium]